MGLGSVVRGLLPVVKQVIGGQDGLMDDVTIQFWEYDIDEYGTSHYSDPVPFQAIVVRKQEMIKTINGQTQQSQTYVAFVEELPARGTGRDRKEPLDERDIITLSDGTTGPILNDLGLMDQATSAPYLLEVYLG